MGINGLLVELKSITRKSHLRSLSNLRVGIDGHSWLYRGAFSCADDLQNSTKYVSFFKKMVLLLKSNGLQDFIVVFDGLALPMKHDVNEKRSQSKKENLQLAMQAAKVGDTDLAVSYYRKAISITPEMISAVIKMLQNEGVAFLVSPYESDAQLTFLSKNGYIDAVITEDSDIIAYGCEHVVLKLDKDGNCDEIKWVDFALNQDLCFKGWPLDQFQLFCCLAGCDYLKNIKGVGVKTAHKLAAAHKTLDGLQRHCSTAHKNQMDAAYLGALELAMQTFRHQTIYNPLTKRLQPLNPIPPQLSRKMDVSVFGPLLDDGIASLLAQGRISAGTISGPLNTKAESNVKEPSLDSSVSRAPLRLPNEPDKYETASSRHEQTSVSKSNSVSCEKDIFVGQRSREMEDRPEGFELKGMLQIAETTVIQPQWGLEEAQGFYRRQFRSNGPKDSQGRSSDNAVYQQQTVRSSAQSFGSRESSLQNELSTRSIQSTHDAFRNCGSGTPAAGLTAGYGDGGEEHHSDYVSDYFDDSRLADHPDMWAFSGPSKSENSTSRNGKHGAVVTAATVMKQRKKPSRESKRGMGMLLMSESFTSPLVTDDWSNLHRRRKMQRHDFTGGNCVNGDVFGGDHHGKEFGNLDREHCTDQTLPPSSSDLNWKDRCGPNMHSGLDDSCDSGLSEFHDFGSERKLFSGLHQQRPLGHCVDPIQQDVSGYVVPGKQYGRVDEGPNLSQLGSRGGHWRHQSRWDCKSGPFASSGRSHSQGHLYSAPSILGQKMSAEYYFDCELDPFSSSSSGGWRPDTSGALVGIGARIGASIFTVAHTGTGPTIGVHQGSIIGGGGGREGGGGGGEGGGVCFPGLVLADQEDGGDDRWGSGCTLICGDSRTDIVPCTDDLSGRAPTGTVYGFVGSDRPPFVGPRISNEANDAQGDRWPGSASVESSNYDDDAGGDDNDYLPLSNYMLQHEAFPLEEKQRPATSAVPASSCSVRSSSNSNPWSRNSEDFFCSEDGLATGSRKDDWPTVPLWRLHSRAEGGPTSNSSSGGTGDGGGRSGGCGDVGDGATGEENGGGSGYQSQPPQKRGNSGPWRGGLSMALMGVNNFDSTTRTGCELGYKGVGMNSELQKLQRPDASGLSTLLAEHTQHERLVCHRTEVFANANATLEPSYRHVAQASLNVEAQSDKLAPLWPQSHLSSTRAGGLSHACRYRTSSIETDSINPGVGTFHW